MLTWKRAGRRLGDGEAHNASAVLPVITPGARRWAAAYWIHIKWNFGESAGWRQRVAIPPSNHPPHHNPSVLPPSLPPSSTAWFLLIHLFCHICSLSLTCQLFSTTLTLCSLEVWLLSLSLSLSLSYTHTHAYTHTHTHTHAYTHTHTQFPLILFFSLGQTSGVLFQCLYRILWLLYFLESCGPRFQHRSAFVLTWPLALPLAVLLTWLFSTSFCNRLSACNSFYQLFAGICIPFKRSWSMPGRIQITP